MKKFTKLLILMAAITLLTVLLAISAFAQVITGHCGTDVTYKLDTSTSVLEISGTGEMYDYSYTGSYHYYYTTAPWGSYKSYWKTVIISDGVTSIGDYAFYNCSNLASVTIPDSVTSIGDEAFEDCSSLKKLYITDLESWLNVKLRNYSSNPLYSAGGNLYINGVLATVIVIPDTVSSIGYGAFCNCDSIKSVTISDTVSSIGYGAFYNCDSIKSVTIPYSVTSIGSCAFYDTAYYNKLSNWENGTVLYIGNHLIDVNDSISGSYSIKDGILNIAGYAFSSCSSLASVTIPDSVTSIGMYAFRNCSSLESIKFETKNATISLNAFNYCTNIETIYCYRNSTADEFFSDDEYTKRCIGEDFIFFDGYQVREEGYNGLRSLFTVDFDAMPMLERDGFEVIELGAIFVSTDKLVEMGDEFTVSKGGDGTYKTVSYGMNVPVIKKGALVGNYVSKSSDNLTFACTITNFNITNYNKLVSSRGYAVLADANGNEYVVYCDYEVEEYRSVSLEMICDALYGEGQITAYNISYSNVVAFRKED